MGRRTVGPLSLALCLLAGPLASDAKAQDGSDAVEDNRAKELFQNGSLLYEEGQYEEAVLAWEKAYELSARPLLLFNIANAYERIGAWQDALDALNRYRAFAPGEERETLERRIFNLNRRLDNKLQQDQSAAATGPAPKPETAEESNPELEVLPPSARTLRRPGPDPGPFVLLGLGAAAAGTGGVLGALAQTAREQVAASCALAGDKLLCPQSSSSLIQQDKTYSLSSDILVAAGSAAAGIGIVLAIVDGATRARNKAASLRILPVAGPQEAAVVVTGRF